MRLISWNVRQGGGARISAQIRSLYERRPDIVALQEVTKKTVDDFSSRLKKIGLEHATDSFQLVERGTQLKGPRVFGQLIASRWPIRSLKPSSFYVPWRERVLSVVVKSPHGAIEVHTTHIPPGVTNDWKKIQTLEGIFKRLARKSTRHRILCGDFNTPQAETPDGKVVTWGQYIDLNGDVKLRRGWGARWDLAERNVMIGLETYDLRDVFRWLNGYEAQKFSWFWKARGKSVGRRFDHVFASRSLNALKCEYLDGFRRRKLSDHSPIEACFRPRRLKAG